MDKDKKYLLAKEFMPFPSYDTLLGALNTMALLLSGVSSGSLELTEDVISEIKDVLDFALSVQSMAVDDRFSELLDRDNRRFRNAIKDACEREGINYDEASQIVKANTEIGVEKFDLAIKRAKKERN